MSHADAKSVPLEPKTGTEYFRQVVATEYDEEVRKQMLQGGAVMNEAATRTEPSSANDYQRRHVLCMLRSYKQWTGRDLYGVDLTSESLAKDLFEAPFVLISHDTQGEPVFNYGNQAALKLWEMNWREFTQLPSRRSAEPLAQPERQKLLGEVSQKGFMADYAGVRISKTGRRFLIRRAVVWNLIDDNNRNCGQAAAFDEWEYL